MSPGERRRFWDPPLLLCGWAFVALWPLGSGRCHWGLARETVELGLEGPCRALSVLKEAETPWVEG